MATMRLDLGKDSYDIVMERGILSSADKYLNLNRKVLIVTDDGVPEIYAKTVLNKCKQGFIVTLKQGEASKNLDNFAYLLHKCLEYNFNRHDCIVACGGGVIGDMAGFVAASYMRGIDFYNIPTTTLSQLDSSIGGKVAVDFEGVKNIVGAFYQPKKVLIDPEVLKTQSKRQLVNGLAEAIKMGAILDSKLFEIFESGKGIERIDEAIWLALLAKKYVVEIDEKEMGLRKILNFGHTLGHGIESSVGLGQLLHGECVGLGMILISEGEVRDRIKNTLKLYDLPTEFEINVNEAFKALTHDKKGNDDNSVTIVKVTEIGKAYTKKVKYDDLYQLLEGK